MINLNVKTIVERDEEGNIVQYFAQAISEFGFSNVEPVEVGQVIASDNGATVSIFYKRTEERVLAFRTPIVHRFVISGELLTPEKPALSVTLFEQGTLSKKKKRVVHREDSDEDQMPGALKM